VGGARGRGTPAIALTMRPRRCTLTAQMPKDLVKELVAERTRRNPEFPRLVAEAAERRKLAADENLRRDGLIARVGNVRSASRRHP